MSLDNAADNTLGPIIDDATEPFDGPGGSIAVDQFTTMTDRELLESAARDLFAIKTIVSEVRDGIGPMIEKAQSNPLLRGFFK